MGIIKETIYENDYLMKFIKDKEAAKTIGSSSTKKLIWVCPNCKTELINTPGHVKRRGFSCEICKDNRSYSERLMERLLIDNNIEYKCQKKFDECVYKGKLPFDFYLPTYNICVEMQGEQHYNVHKNSAWYNDTMIKSDDIKKCFCENNGIKYIAINCSVSDMKVIVRNVLDTELSNIFEYINYESLAEAVMTRTLTFDIDYIIEQHLLGKSLLKISDETGISRKKIVQILKKIGKYQPRAGKKNNSRKVIRLNDRKIYNSIKEATIDVNLKQENNIVMVCKNKRKFAGKDKVTGEKYRWMYYEDYLIQAKSNNNMV